MQNHRISMFGQKVAVILESQNWTDPHIYLRFLKKKADDTWEKPSAKEGKVIKLNLLEIIAIRDLCISNGGKWSTVHVFGEEKTSISMEKDAQNLKLNIPGYSKFIQYPESTLLTELIVHLVIEKLNYATGGSQNSPKSEEQDNLPTQSADILTFTPEKNQSPSNQVAPIVMDESIENSLIKNDTPKSTTDWIAALQKNEDYYLIPGQITAQRPKAIAFQIIGKNQIWIPISTIQNTDHISTLDGVWVKQWWLEKNLDKINTS